MTTTEPAAAADWPYTITDPVRAVHFALEPDCPYSNPTACPYETDARQAVEAHQRWQEAQHRRIDERVARHLAAEDWCPQQADDAWWNSRPDTFRTQYLASARHLIAMIRNADSTTKD